MSVFNIEKKTFNVHGRKLFAHIYTPINSTFEKTIIALHGWMDNLASFQLLNEYLLSEKGLAIRIVAIDLAGHGKSDHLTGLGAYNIWSDIPDIIAVTKLLSLDRFSLVGHSRGAMIATLIAGAFPEHVDDLIVLDSIIPAVAESDLVAKHLVESVASQIVLSEKKQNYYSTFGDAVMARQRGVVPLGKADAEILANHGVEKSKDGFYWNMAILLMAPSEVKLSIEQVDAFFSRIRAKILLIIADQGLAVQHPALMRWIKLRDSICVRRVEGSHHFHMNENYKQTAELIFKHFTH